MQKKEQFVENIRVTANVLVYLFPADKVPNYNAFLLIGEGVAFPGVRHARCMERGWCKVQERNLVVSAGLAQIVNLMIGVNTNSFNYVGVGSGSSTPVAGNTDLGTAISPRQTVTSRYLVGSTEAHWDTFFSTSQNNGTWNESGIFDASSSGDMLCRKLFGASFTKDTTKTATIQWKVTFTAV